MSLFTSIATSKMVNNIVLGFVRTTMATAIPALIAGGWLQQNQATDLLGSVMFIAALALSGLDKVVRESQHQAALSVVPEGYVPAPVVQSAPTPPAEAGPVTMKPIPN